MRVLDICCLWWLLVQFDLVMMIDLICCCISDFIWVSLLLGVCLVCVIWIDWFLNVVLWIMLLVMLEKQGLLILCMMSLIVGISLFVRFLVCMLGLQLSCWVMFCICVVVLGEILDLLDIVCDVFVREMLVVLVILMSCGVFLCFMKFFFEE